VRAKMRADGQRHDFGGRGQSRDAICARHTHRDGLLMCVADFRATDFSPTDGALVNAPARLSRAILDGPMSNIRVASYSK
jgi:hypothetical protein